jgi:hypothetical protein
VCVSSTGLLASLRSYILLSLAPVFYSSFPGLLVGSSVPLVLTMEEVTSEELAVDAAVRGGRGGGGRNWCAYVMWRWLLLHQYSRLMGQHSQCKAYLP